jgi:hypothetical protein
MDKLEEYYKSIVQDMGDEEFIALVSQVQTNQYKIALELKNPDVISLPAWLNAECQRRIQKMGGK